MNYLKQSLINTKDFLLGSKDYFKNVLLMHSFILFFLIPLLSSSIKFILKKGNIYYLSFDNLGEIIRQHPFVTINLLLVLLAILLAVFFEFTFLLLSVYFIKKKQPVSLQNLLQLTFSQLRKIRFQTVLFFFFYFFLILPIGGVLFQSDLLTKVTIPAFIIDFIFANRLIIITLFILLYLTMIYLGVRLLFALPEIILKQTPFKEALSKSWRLTQKSFIAIITQLAMIAIATLGVTSLGFFLVISAQSLIEEAFPAIALVSAVIAMTFLQIILVINTVLSTISIFYVTIHLMEVANILPEISDSFPQSQSPRKSRRIVHLFLLVGILCLVFGVAFYNYDYLTNFTVSKPQTVSHRGVSNKNGVQNSLAALEKTHIDYQPDYIEMDIQLTVDNQFIVYHDFNFKALTDYPKKPEESTIAEALALTVSENGQTAPVIGFDEYLNSADLLNQKLMIEIKTQKKDVSELVRLFLDRYQTRLEEKGHVIQSLSFQVIEEIKTHAPKLTAGYILPFSIAGPPISKADFLTLEYTTLNRHFIEATQAEGMAVYVWTPNDEETMKRMIFYGVDGIITDRMDLLNQAIQQPELETYSDKLLNFVLGYG